MKKNNEKSVEKEDFIAFLASMKPGDTDKLIREKGKPPKPICPAFFFPTKE